MPSLLNFVCMYESWRLDNNVFNDGTVGEQQIRELHFLS